MSLEKVGWKELVQPSLSPSSEPLEWAEAVSIIDSYVHEGIANAIDDGEKDRLMTAWSRMLRG